MMIRINLADSQLLYIRSHSLGQSIDASSTITVWYCCIDTSLNLRSLFCSKDISPVSLLIFSFRSSNDWMVVNVRLYASSPRFTFSISTSFAVWVGAHTAILRVVSARMRISQDITKVFPVPAYPVIRAVWPLFRTSVLFSTSFCPGVRISITCFTVSSRGLEEK